LLPSPWFEAERTWRLRRAGLSLGAAEELWARAKPILERRLETEASLLRKFVVADFESPSPVVQDTLL